MRSHFFEFLYLIAKGKKKPHYIEKMSELTRNISVIQKVGFIAPLSQGECIPWKL